MVNLVNVDVPLGVSPRLPPAGQVDRGAYSGVRARAEDNWRTMKGEIKQRSEYLYRVHVLRCCIEVRSLIPTFRLRFEISGTCVAFEWRRRFFCRFRGDLGSMGHFPVTGKLGVHNSS